MEKESPRMQILFYYLKDSNNFKRKEGGAHGGYNASFLWVKEMTKALTKFNFLVLRILL